MDNPTSMSALAATLSNLITATRAVSRDLHEQSHESADWADRALSCLWRALGFANEDSVALGILDTAPGLVETTWPEDAKPVAVAYNQPIFAIERDGVTYYSARLSGDGPQFWSENVDFAFALLCASISQLCVPEALSRLDVH